MNGWTSAWWISIERARNETTFATNVPSSEWNKRKYITYEWQAKQSSHLVFKSILKRIRDERAADMQIGRRARASWMSNPSYAPPAQQLKQRVPVIARMADFTTGSYADFKKTVALSHFYLFKRTWKTKQICKLLFVKGGESKERKPVHFSCDDPIDSITKTRNRHWNRRGARWRS